MPYVHSHKDYVCWNLFANETFTSKSAYSYIEQENQCMKDKIWECIWKWDGPERIKTFL